MLPEKTIAAQTYPLSFDSNPHDTAEHTRAERSQAIDPEQIKQMLLEISQRREEHANLSDEAWVKRIVADTTLEAKEVQEHWFNELLLEEVYLMPEYGKAKMRDEYEPIEDFEDHAGDPVIPESVYACGLVWDVGERLGGGAQGQVYEIAHLGPTDRQRVVKFMAAEGGGEMVARKNEHLHNEIAAAVASGDFVGSEVVRDEKGGFWVAVILERHEGRTGMDLLREDYSEGKVRYRDPKEAYKIALATRSILSGIRKMHAAGWIHQDIKPGNIILNEIDGEETLSRPIDLGLAEKVGNVRPLPQEDEPRGLLMGTPNYLPPEAITDSDVDRRMRDYWALVLTTSRLLGLIKPKPGFQGGPYQVFASMASGTYLEAPNLQREEYRDAVFENQKIDGALREFNQWLYDFVRPHNDMHERQGFWRKTGVTKKLTLDVKTKGGVIQQREGDFIDDEKFVRELEAHIRTLAEQAGLDSPEQALALLQEFPNPDGTDA